VAFWCKQVKPTISYWLVLFSKTRAEKLSLNEVRDEKNHSEHYALRPQKSDFLFKNRLPTDRRLHQLRVYNTYLRTPSAVCSVYDIRSVDVYAYVYVCVRMHVCVFYRVSHKQLQKRRDDLIMIQRKKTSTCTDVKLLM